MTTVESFFFTSLEAGHLQGLVNYYNLIPREMRTHHTFYLQTQSHGRQMLKKNKKKNRPPALKVQPRPPLSRNSTKNSKQGYLTSDILSVLNYLLSPDGKGRAPAVP